MISRKKRVLIFGAYANGNLGDAEQAASVARHLRNHDDTLEIYASSHSTSDRLYYPCPAFLTRNKIDILDIDFVNSFDALVIGGGGLLASRHKPLNAEEWVEKINIPIGILAVGANEEISNLCKPLLQKAKVISVRDSYSLNAVQSIRSDAFLLRDPILSDRSIDESPMENARLGTSRLCVIPRKLVSKAEPVYQRISETMVSRDFVITVFPATDEASGALDFFSRQTKHEATEMKSFVSMVRKADLVVSDRYHGCIIAMKLGLSTLPCLRSRADEASKIFNLYRDLNMANELFDGNLDLSRNDIFALARSFYDAQAVKAQLNAWYDNFDAGFVRFCRELLI
jgi:polysaccharide pyruvyl transferase WcaK-like protein